MNLPTKQADGSGRFYEYVGGFFERSLLFDLRL